MRRPNVPKYGRELMREVDEQARFELEWKISGSGHLQPLRKRGGGPAEPIVDAAGRVVVSSLTPSNERGARASFLRDLSRAGVIRDVKIHRTAPKQAQAPDQDELRRRRNRHRERNELLDVISGASTRLLRGFANEAVQELRAA